MEQTLKNQYTVQWFRIPWSPAMLQLHGGSAISSGNILNHNLRYLTIIELQMIFTKLHWAKKSSEFGHLSLFTCSLNYLSALESVTCNCLLTKFNFNEQNYMGLSVIDSKCALDSKFQYVISIGRWLSTVIRISCPWGQAPGSIPAWTIYPRGESR